jgi:hypothetical protein
MAEPLTARQLLDLFPWIKWTEPQLVSTPDGSWLTCRFCTARDGLRAIDVPFRSFPAREQFEHHLQEVHGL